MVSLYGLAALQLTKLHKNRELYVNARFGRWRECSFTAFKAETQNAWSYTSAPPICLQSLHRDNSFSTLVTERDKFQQGPFILYLSIEIKQKWCISDYF